MGNKYVENTKKITHNKAMQASIPWQPHAC